MIYLNKIKTLLANSNTKESLNQNEKDGFKLICNALNSPKTSVKFNNSQTLMVYLDAFEIAVNKFHAKTGFKIREGVSSGTTNGAVKELTIANSRNLDGGWFGIREMNQLEASNVSRIDWDFDDDAYDCGNNSCQFDVEMVAGQTPRYYEYKSKSMNTDADSPVEINPKQFKAYLSKIANMAELEYVFQSEKLYKGGGTTLSLEQGLANRFKKLISNDIDGFFNVIWANNLGLRTDLFGTRNRDDAEDYFSKTLVPTISSRLYNFITIR